MSARIKLQCLSPLQYQFWILRYFIQAYICLLNETIPLKILYVVHLVNSYIHILSSLTLIKMKIVEILSILWSLVTCLTLHIWIIKISSLALGIYSDQWPLVLMKLLTGAIWVNSKAECKNHLGILPP